MKVEVNKNLKSLNQFGVKTIAKYFVELNTEEDIQKVLQSPYAKEDILLLGEGNNILFTRDFNGLVIKPNFKGREILREDDHYIWIKVHSGEHWDDFVIWTVDNNYQGIENMILIPSSVGGAVSQNIAAYGQNIMDVIDEVETIDIRSGEKKIFKHNECKFSYRDSIFKSQFKNRYIITSAIFRLNKSADHLETSYHERKSRYGSLEDELKSFAKEPYSLKDVKQAVINQRNKKLPKIEEYGTVGSVFANPVVTKDKYLELSKRISELQSYPVEKLQYERRNWTEVDDEFVKIPAGRIIDELGWRGKWEGNVGVYDKHALCVVTNREAEGKEILNFLEKIRSNVKVVYDIDLTYEINIIP